MKVLIIEDEEELAKSIHRYLKKEKYLCEIAVNITEGRKLIEYFNYDCIILDINLPEGSGLTLLSELKEEQRMDGVIIISARNALEDKINSLKLGADDYLTKPFHLAELSARIEAIIRRRFLNNSKEIVIGNLVIDTATRIATIEGNEMSLTRTEYELLLFLTINKDRVVSKNAIAEHLSGQSAFYLDNYDIIYAHIKNLKRKLLSMGSTIKTVYGTGYKFTA